MATKKAAARKMAGRKSTKAAKKQRATKRELIEPRGDQRFVRRDGTGRFHESDDVGRSLGADRRKPAKNKVRAGYGDRGDR